MPHTTDVASISGWRRANGRVGIRNRVIVMALDTEVVPLAKALAKDTGSVAVSPAYFTTEATAARCEAMVVGTASNPNVAGTVILGSDRALRTRVVEQVVCAGGIASGFAIEQAEQAERIARRYQAVAAAEPVTVGIGELWISTKCEESDATTALASCPAVGALIDRLLPLGIHAVFGETPELAGIVDLVASRAADAPTAAKWLSVAAERSADHAARSLHPQPTEANIGAGISTLEEKGLNSLAKIGRDGKFLDVLAPAEPPTRGPGLYLMDTSSETEIIAEMVAAGFVMHLLPTGRPCNVTNPIVPVIQINGNPTLADNTMQRIDVDLRPVVRGAETVLEASQRLLSAVVAAASGVSVSAESE